MGVKFPVQSVICMVSNSSMFCLPIILWATVYQSLSKLYTMSSCKFIVYSHLNVHNLTYSQAHQNIIVYMQSSMAST